MSKRARVTDRRLQLIGVRITNYRSVEDSEEFTVEPGVTFLVDKNEGGKTAVQQAIYRCNPMEASATFDEVVDFPVRLTRQRKQWGDEERIPVFELTFRFEADRSRPLRTTSAQERFGFPSSP